MYLRTEIFKAELAYIKSAVIREFTAKIINILPEYFFEVPASSTGKYHPDYALGDGGLVRHTKAAVNIAYQLMQLEQCSFTQDEKDLIISALIAHDGLKSGVEKQTYTVADHPLQVVNFVSSHEEIKNLISEDYYTVWSNAIASHMGQWNTDYKTKQEILPKPSTSVEKFVHMCDYIASRKDWTFNFPDGYYQPAQFETPDPIDYLIDSIITLCKKHIANGVDRTTLYSLIASYNNGNKNPASIKDVGVANTILDKLEEIGK